MPGSHHVHQPNTSTDGGSTFSVRGFAPPDSRAAAATPLLQEGGRAFETRRSLKLTLRQAGCAKIAQEMQGGRHKTQGICGILGGLQLIDLISNFIIDLIF